MVEKEEIKNIYEIYYKIILVIHVLLNNIIYKKIIKFKYFNHEYYKCKINFILFLFLF